ncbi:S41 family peptidase [Streptomyces sp. CB01881]|uniref:S41 family peptidase n=1 Tax=Streptomyces sp. CB01881 TaxID=2078691 RepID=UPI000CDC15EB|nr:S41 family peptidase [Streptomyces sp. CB01881]AUY51552.1 peptidase S41 [Streptomyces sp. CB01881]TYC74943.1 PDZ domain-containing protein [Streptomyces sp. CB01881]
MLQTPRRARQAATLSLVFGAVLLAGAATGAWGDPSAPPHRPSVDAAPAAAAGVAAGQDPAGAALSEQQAEHLIGANGDRWGAYYSAQEYAEFSQGLDGRYLGVGLSVGRGQDGVTEVSQVQPAGPAAEAGIAAGDRLLRVGPDQADHLPVTEVVARLRGREGERRIGSEVTLAVQRGDGGIREVQLRRALLDSQQVAVEHLDKGVLRITVRAFTSGVAEQVRAAVRGPHAGVVLDLRGNSGGLVEEAAGTAGIFLDGGPVGSYQERGGTRELTAPPGGDQRSPLVVLVDGGTMSAAELLTGALQDRSRAVVVGGRTFGKGTVQQPSRLADGAVLELTVGRYYTPAGRSPEGAGLTPDVPASGSEDAGELALRVLAGLGTRA